MSNGRHSTLIASQLPTEHWHHYIGEALLVDAIPDRSHHLYLHGESMRKLTAK